MIYDSVCCLIYRITKESIEKFSQSLLANLFSAMGHEGSEENEYVMKSIMRTLSLLQEKMIPYMQTIVSELTSKLMLVAKVTYFE